MPTSTSKNNWRTTLQGPGCRTCANCGGTHTGAYQACGRCELAGSPVAYVAPQTGVVDNAELDTAVNELVTKLLLVGTKGEKELEYVLSSVFERLAVVYKQDKWDAVRPYISQPESNELLRRCSNCSRGRTTICPFKQQGQCVDTSKWRPGWPR